MDRRRGGLTLLEVAIGMALLGGLVLLLLTSMRSQSAALGQSNDAMNTSGRAGSVLRALREELRGVVQNPSGVDGYEVAQDHVQFRPVIGFVPDDDANLASYRALTSPDRRLSSNQILYAAFVKRIFYEPATRRIVVRTTPGFDRTIATDVDEFTFFNAESLQTLPDFTPPARKPLTGMVTVLPAPGTGAALLPDVNTFNLGVRLVIGARSSAPTGRTLRQWSYSNVLPDRSGVEGQCRAGGVLSTSVLILPETITNSKSKPVTSP